MKTISERDAIAQTEAVKKIMAERKMDFGPAYDVYITKARDRAHLHRDWGRGLADSADD